MNRLLDYCRERKLETVRGIALADNSNMHALARGCGFALRPAPDGTVLMALRLS
jgi:hypothetical protein